MALTNNNVTKSSISGLNYNSILQDLYNAIKSNAELSQNFTDFSSAEGTRLFAEMYAYVADQLANRIDVIGNELFVDTASTSALTRLLKLVSYKLDFPSASSAEVSLVTSNSSGDEIVLSPGINKNETEVVFNGNSFKGLASNNGIYFEFINYDTLNNKFDYLTEIKWETPNNGTVPINIYEGRTNSMVRTISTTGKNVINIDTSVIKNSVSIFFQKKKLVDDRYDVVELKQVDNFFCTDALTSDVACYTIRNTGNGKCEIILQPKEEDLNETIIVMYRVGGGAYSIPAETIDTTENITIGNTKATVRYRNIKAGFSGKNELTAEQIREKISGEVRSSYIATSSEDFEYIFPKLDDKIKFIKTFGEASDNFEDICKTYGYAVNPLNVWSLLLKDNYELSQKLHEVANLEGITDCINDICFEILDKNPRFNEKYQVKKASINQFIPKSEIETYYDGGNRAYFIPLSRDASETLESGDAKIIVTKKPYIETGNEATNGVNAFKNTDCVYDNLKLVDGITSRNYIQYSSDSKRFEKIYSEFRTAFTSNGDSITVGENTKFIITIDGVKYEIDLAPGAYDSARLANAINAQINPISYMVILRDAINSDVWKSASAYTYRFNTERQYSGTTAFSISVKESEASTKEMTFDYEIDGVNDTFETIKDKINEQIRTKLYPNLEDDETPDVVADYYMYEDGCYRLVLVSKYPFTYSDSASEVYFKEGYICQKENPEMTLLEASMTDDVQDGWPVFGSNVARLDNGNLMLDFPGGANDMSLTGDDILLSLFDAGDGVPRRSHRVLDCTHYTDKSTLVIYVSSSEDKITDDLYINVFGTAINTINLGSYYFNKYSDDLLKRTQIKNLYSTKRFKDGSIDEYGSDYQIEMTSDYIGGKTYNQIVDPNDRAKIKVVPNSEGQCILSGDLRLKVDSIDRTDSKSVSVSGTYFNVEAEDGYLKINANSLSFKKVSEIIDLLTSDELFGNYLEYDEEDGCIKTKSANYKSSIDFSGSDSSVIEYLFGGVYTAIGKTRVIDLTKIERGSIHFTNNYKQNLNVIVSINGNSRTVSTGSSPEEFCENLNDEFNNAFSIFERTLYFKNMTRGTNYRFLFYCENYDEANVRKMFVNSEMFTNVIDNQILYLKFDWTNTGDYYISHDESDNNAPYKLHVENPSVFPYGNIFIHMFEDYTYDSVVSESEGVPTYTDEHVWKHLIEKNSPTMINHVFKQPRFDTFDLEVKCSVKNKIGLAAIPEYEKKVSEYLRERYDVYNSVLGQSVAVSDIELGIKRNVPEIEVAKVTYFGKELSLAETHQNSLDCDFNHKLILASNKFEEKRYFNSYNVIKKKDIQTHGLKVTVDYID